MQDRDAPDVPTQRMARILGAPFVSKAAIMAGCAGDDAEQVPFEGMPDVPTVERLIAERDAALAELERLRGYARHHFNCATMFAPIMGPERECTCGLDKI